MTKITVVTGNIQKLKELQSIFPNDILLHSTKLDLVEIQSLDISKIVYNKLLQAYEVVKGPVIVEDVSAELESLNGLPGPFIKFFEERLGNDALYKLSGESRARIICCMGYHDGTQTYIVEGIMDGRIVAPRTYEGFGFDCVFIPDGFEDTLAELGIEIKNTMSHRYKAATALYELL